LTTPARAGIVNPKPVPTTAFERAMSEPAPGDLTLLSAFKAGDDSAARELFDRYCERLMRLARRRIGQRMTSRVDPEDILQSVFRSFFLRARNDEFSFHAEDDLLKLLVRITVHKSLRQVAHHRAAKRNPEQELMQASDGDDFLALVAADEPGPEVEVALLDELEKFMCRLPEFDRDVLSMKVQGYSTVEIAEKLGSYDRKVRRALERIQATAEGHMKPTAD
jgi:RNA polymerase sigma-70 factor (ECF subfamily)